MCSINFFQGVEMMRGNNESIRPKVNNEERTPRCVPFHDLWRFMMGSMADDAREMYGSWEINVGDPVSQEIRRGTRQGGFKVFMDDNDEAQKKEEEKIEEGSYR